MMRMEWRIGKNMKPETKQLIIAIMEDTEDQYLWTSGYNTFFGMSPQEMIDLGREDEVVSYLKWAAYGPY